MQWMKKSGMHPDTNQHQCSGGDGVGFLLIWCRPRIISLSWISSPPDDSHQLGSCWVVLKLGATLLHLAQINQMLPNKKHIAAFK